MYELILTVMVQFAGPVAELDGHGVSMLTQQYRVAVQGFSTREECLNFAAFPGIESFLTSAYGTTTTVSQENTPHCIVEPAATTTSN
jgi:hypothetical protein